MDKKNIVFNHTLEQYNKKYRNRTYRLLKYSKKQVEDFDKQYGHYVFNNKTYSLEFNHYLLKDRKWALIGDTYYEIPKPVRFTWFRNLSAGAQITTCVLGAGVVATAVVVPTVIALNNGPKEKNRETAIDPSVAHVKCASEIVDGNLEITLQVEDKYLVYEIESVTINGSKLKKKEFSYDMPTKKVTIKKEVLDKHTSGKVIVKPVVEDDIDFSMYLDFTKIGETNYCEVSGKNGLLCLRS